MSEMEEITQRNPVIMTSTMKEAESEQQPASLWQQYTALLKRNYIIKKREKSKTATELLMPLYFLFFLSVMRLTIPSPTYPALMDPHDNGTLGFSLLMMTNITYHVSPDNSSEVQTIMDRVTSLTNSNVSYYQSEQDIIKYYQKEIEKIEVVVIFTESPHTDLNYTIRFSPKYRALPPADNVYRANSACRNVGSLVGGLENQFNCQTNGYYQTGFIGLQYLIDNLILMDPDDLEAFTDFAKDFPSSSLLNRYLLESYPKEELVSDNLDTLRSIIPLYMVMTWAQFIVYMLILIVEEKEKKIKEGMKMMGLQAIVYWLSWLTVYGIYVLALAIVCTIILPLVQVFRYANMGIVFVLFVLYGISAIAMGIMLTPFFSNAKAAGAIGNLVQVLMSTLFYVQVYVGDQIDTVYYYLMSLLSPCAFSFAIDKVLYFDVVDNGLSSSNLWDGPGMPVGGSIVMICVDIVIYFLLALYLDAVVPTEYGTKEKPLFCVSPSYWRTRRNTRLNNSYSNPSLSDDSSTSSGTHNDDIEEVPEELKKKEAVVLRNISKTFYPGRGQDPINAVKDFSLTIYEGQITAILGHNGAGKTTLFNILTGMTAPSGGSASIFGYDITNSSDLKMIRKMTGVCPQHDILFDTLTPREHLVFYARIRGMPSESLNSAVTQTLQEVDLTTKADAKAVDLSGGQKRKLSIGIALIGDPKIIFLDEPTAGVDAYSRRYLWNLLKNRKEGKVILLTTHFMDEADILADRKAVITDGSLRCCGSSLFLKNKFGVGYHLTLIAPQSSPSASALRFIQSVVPGAELARHYGKEMSFILPYESTDKFSALFEALDYHKQLKDQELVVEDYGISMTSLEEVFLSLNEKKESKVEGEETSSTVKSKPFALEQVEVDFSWWRSFKALLYMRYLGLLREPVAVVFLLVFTLGLTAGSMAVINAQSYGVATDLNSMTFSPDTDTSPYPLTLLTDEASQPFLEALFNETDFVQHDYNGSYSSIFPLRPSSGAVSSEASDFLSSSFIVAYNDSFLHILPSLLNTITNAALLNSDPSTPALLVTTSRMLPSIQSSLQWNAGTFFAPFLLGMVLTIVPAAMFIELVIDREMKARNLLRLNGVSFHLYFSSFFILIFSVCMIAYIGLLILIQAFQVTSLVIPEAYLNVALLYLLYTITILPYGGTITHLFDKAETARTFLPNMVSTIGLLSYTLVSILDLLLPESDAGLISHCVMSVVMPFYIPYGAIYYINKVYLQCSLFNTCDELTLADYQTTEIMVLYIMCPVNLVVYYFTLRICDAWKTGGSIREAFFLKSKDTAKSDEALLREEAVQNKEEDEDVKEERRQVQRIIGSEDASVPPAHIYNLGKTYTKNAEGNRCKKGKTTPNVFEAVKSVSLSVKPGEVLGLLGPNGAGKTSTLKILTAEEQPTRGGVWVNGGRITSVHSNSLTDIGYCPQHNCTWKNITIREHLELYAHVRGVRVSQMEELVDAYLQGLQITEHADKKSKDCSGGTKRKLSYVISMIGKPSIVLLDEPSTGMDPKSKRFLWDSILVSFKGSRSAVLTTHSMEEADALCARVSIMVKGIMRCIGSVQHLKNIYGGGYTLELKLGQQQDINQLQDSMKSLFPNATLEEAPFEDRLVYKVMQKDVTSLAKCFQSLQQMKNSDLVKEYAFSQTTLEQVFLLFAKQQEEEDPDDSD